jgi:hypothetical protein
VPQEKPDVMRLIYSQLDARLFFDGALDVRRAGVGPEVEEGLRRVRFRRLMTAFHPDRHPDSAEWLTPRSQAVLEAYQRFRKGDEAPVSAASAGEQPAKPTKRKKHHRHEAPPDRNSARLTPERPGPLTRLRIRLRRVENLPTKILAGLAVLALVPVISVWLAYKPYRDRLAPEPAVPVAGQASDGPAYATLHPPRPDPVPGSNESGGAGAGSDSGALDSSADETALAGDALPGEIDTRNPSRGGAEAGKSQDGAPPLLELTSKAAQMLLTWEVPEGGEVSGDDSSRSGDPTDESVAIEAERTGGSDLQIANEDGTEAAMAEAEEQLLAQAITEPSIRAMVEDGVDSGTGASGEDESRLGSRSHVTADAGGENSGRSDRQVAMQGQPEGSEGESDAVPEVEAESRLGSRSHVTADTGGENSGGSDRQVAMEGGSNGSERESGAVLGGESGSRSGDRSHVTGGESSGGSDLQVAKEGAPETQAEAIGPTEADPTSERPQPTSDLRPPTLIPEPEPKPDREPQPTIDERIQHLLNTWSLHFRFGNIDGIMATLADNPRENDNRGRAWFRDNYGTALREADERRMDIEVLGVDARSWGWAVDARFDLFLDYPDDEPVELRQRVEYRIIETDSGELRIQAIEY